MHQSGSPLSVAHRPDSETGQLLSPPCRKPEVRPPPRSAVGVLLLDPSLSPVAFNAEAIRVLSYPTQLEDVGRPDLFLSGKIRGSLLSQQPARDSALVTEFRSGRRRYLCRAFVVDSGAKGPSRASIAVLLERAPFGVIPLSPVSEQFNLTRRERDALESLLQGLSNKEIASRMNVSPNTVKAFLRMIMLKMAVTSRTAILAKIMMTNP